MLRDCALILAVISLICIGITSSTEAPSAETPRGRLTGKYLTSRDGKAYEAFLGIRYGVIPERFQNSILSPSWEGTKEATEFGSVCPQLIDWNKPGGTEVVGEEDCLFLNVYTPKSDDKKRPVLVFIHGGGFVFGNGDPYGAKYFMDEDIVLVTLNYRLGILGFLNTRDEHAPGNMGLKDQVLALKWVQENIEAFGGDPSKVTISGESAGAGSVMHLVLSPRAKGLIHGAIAGSGTSLNLWAYAESTLSKATTVGKHLQCETGTTQELVTCLKGKSAEEISRSQGIFLEWFMDPLIVFKPSLEIKSEHNPEPFLEDSPRNLIRAGKFNRIPVLMTVNKDEGALLWAAVIARMPELLKDMNENWERVAPLTFWFRDDPALDGRTKEVAQKIRKFYFNNQEITLEKEENLRNLYTDSWFLYGNHETALQMSKYTPVYTGLITHTRKDFSILTKELGVTLENPVIAHGEELPYLFNNANPESQLDTSFLTQEVSDADDLAFSKGFIKIWTSFAATGVAKVPLGNSPNWSPVTNEERQTGQLNWLQLDIQPVLLKNPFKDRMGFWESIYKYNRDEL